MPIEIKLLGPTDATFGRAYAAVKEAITHAHQRVTFATLDDAAELRRLGVDVAPALVVNGAVVAAGRVPEAREIVTWIMNAALREDAH